MKQKAQFITKTFPIKCILHPISQLHDKAKIPQSRRAQNLTLDSKHPDETRGTEALTLGVVDIVLVVGGGRGSGALAALDDLDRVELLVAPPAHHARAHLQGKVRRPRRGRSRGPQPPLHASSVRRGAGPVARRAPGSATGGGTILRCGRRFHGAHLVVRAGQIRCERFGVGPSALFGAFGLLDCAGPELRMTCGTQT